MSFILDGRLMIRPARAPSLEQQEILRKIPGIQCWKNGIIACTPDAGEFVVAMCSRLGIGPCRVSSKPRAVAPGQVQPADLKARLTSLSELRPQIDGHDLWPWLRNFQKWALSYLLHESRDGGFLVAPVGSGKTGMMLIWMLAGEYPGLVITKASVRHQWADEIRRFSTIEPYVLGPKPTTKREMAAWEPYGEYLTRMERADKRSITIVGWESLPDHRAALEMLPAPYAIGMDESQFAKATVRGKYREHETNVREDGNPELVFIPNDSRGTVAADLAKKAARRLAMSVHGDTYVELRGGVFGTGFVGPVADAFALCERCGFRSVREGTHDVIYLGAVEGRAWDGRGFAWRSVRSILRHVAQDASLVGIRTGAGTLVATSDHSVYRVHATEFVQKQGKRRGVAALSEAPAEKIRVGDTLLYDDGYAWDATDGTTREPEYNAFELLRDRTDVRVAVDLSSADWRALGVTPQRWANMRNQHARGETPIRYSLERDRYLQHASALPAPDGIYSRNNARKLLPVSIRFSRWAYMLGFFLGDGWIGADDRVSFAVSKPEVDAVQARLEAIPGIPWKLHRPDRKQRGSKRVGSFELRANHVFLAEILRGVFGGCIPEAHEKRIPSEWITSWPIEARRELLQGLIDSGGCASGWQYFYVTTSEHLARGLMALLRSVGVRGTFGTRKPRLGGFDARGKRIVGRRPGYCIAWSRLAHDGDHAGHRGHRQKYVPGVLRFLEAPVRALAMATSAPFVYDIEMAGGHPSFSAGGVLVHNTGTPVHDRLKDQWAQADLVVPGIFGPTAKRYRQRYTGAMPGEFGGLVEPTGHAGRTNVAELQKRLSFFTVRVPYDVVKAQLPPKRRRVTIVPVEHQNTRGWGLGEVGREIKRLARGLPKNEDERGTRGRYASDDTMDEGARQILDRVTELRIEEAAMKKAPFVLEKIIEFLESGEGKRKVLIISGRQSIVAHFDRELHKKTDKFDAPVQIWSAHGASHDDFERREIQKAYMAHPGPCVLNSTWQSFGVGANLQDTDYLAVVQLPYSPGDIEQIEGRVSRLGQERPALIEYFVAARTIDERVRFIVLDKLPAVNAIAGDATTIEDAMASFARVDQRGERMASLISQIGTWFKDVEGDVDLRDADDDDDD